MTASNFPRTCPRSLTPQQAVFGWGGPPEQTAGFREELTVTVYADGDLGLAWAWGRPGEEFAPRSHVRLATS